MTMMKAASVAFYLNRLYKMEKCVLVRINRTPTGMSVAPLVRGTFSEMVTKMYQYEPMSEVGILTLEGRIYPHDYYPKNNDSSE